MSRRDKQAPWMVRSVRLVPASVAGVLGLALVDAAVAQQAQSLNGPPVQVIPYASEPGVPTITINPGTPNPSPTGGGSGTGGTGGGGNTGDSSALTTLLGTSWGSQAVQNAEALGVNPSALAATCVLESGCSQPSGGGGAQGAFQMFPAAYQEGLAAALAANPGLQSQIISGAAGMNDPTTEAIAASGYLMQGVQSLQNSGIADPTVTQVRAYYQFGPADGTALANASPDATLGSIFQHTSAATLAANGLSPTTTVAQYNAIIASKIGTAATQSVLG